MKYTITDYLHQKASINKIPLYGCFELSPICNFSCKMCYVRKTKEQINKENKKIMDWTDWLALAKECKDMGTLYLLLSGGEPFIYPNFKELYFSLHNMGFIISINSNGTMIDENTVAWLKKAAPSRINITLYGTSKETYKKICGNEDGYTKAINAIMLLKEAGIPVVINASMIPENKDDLQEIIEFGRKHNINTRVSTYMFPPIRRNKENSDSRFSAEEAGNIHMKKYQCMLEKKKFDEYVTCQLATLNNNQRENEENWGIHKEEYMRCRAGRSSFWISWDGSMSACGLVPFPIQVFPFQESFKECWNKLTDKVRTTSVLKECTNCEKREICNPCVAMIFSETGNVNKKSDYLCKMCNTIIDEMKKIKEREADCHE